MTEDRDTNEYRDTGTERPTLGEMNHTNPYTDEPFGDTQTYARGRLVAADGGAADGGAADAVSTVGSGKTDTMADVSHTPPEGAESANAAYQRGNEDGV